MKKIIKKECTVGYRCHFEDKPNMFWYEQGVSESGYYFKDEDAFDNKSNMVCYIPEYDDYWENLSLCNKEEDYLSLGQEICNGRAVGYTYADILDACDGVAPLAETIFHSIDWQHPETLLYEWASENIVDIFYDVSNDGDMKLLKHLAEIYDKDKYGTDWHNYYDFYMQHKK